MRPRMASQHSSLTKASLAATTVTAPLPPSVRCSLKVPLPSAKADPQPCPSWNFGLSYAHPLAAGVSRASSRHDVVCPFSCIVGTYNVFAFHVLCPEWAAARHTGSKSKSKIGKLVVKTFQILVGLLGTVHVCAVPPYRTSVPTAPYHFTPCTAGAYLLYRTKVHNVPCQRAHCTVPCEEVCGANK